VSLFRSVSERWRVPVVPGLLAVVLALVATVLSPSGNDAQADEREPFAVRQRVQDIGHPVPLVRLTGGGWGHGVGMSQYGAYAKAREGFGPDAILQHYYPGTELGTDERSATERVRVGIATGRPSSQLEALEEPVTWYACDPADAASLQRVPAEQCVEWFLQAPGEVVRVVPVAEGPGLEVERLTGPGAWEPWQSTEVGVARAAHGDALIRADSQDATQRRYAFGWRDHHRTGTGLAIVQDLDSVDHYLRGLAEVPNSWGLEGATALESQAITGRTFALRRIDAPRGGACACDLLATPADQAFSGEDKVLSEHGDLWRAAVEATAGMVLRFDGALAQTFYSSSHGLGRSENVEDSWAYGAAPVPYLRSVPDPWSAAEGITNPRANWTALVSHDVMADFLSAGRSTPLARVERMTVRSRTEGGTPREVEVAGVTTAGQRETFTFTGRPQDPKPIAGASMRRFLPISVGGTGGRLYSSQLERIGFRPFNDAQIVQGVSTTEFAPNRAVTRGQMATYLVNTFEVATGPVTGRFRDVADSDTHAVNIEALAAAGIAGGYGDGTFRSGEPVTRAQMATFLAQALALSSERTGTFSDVGSGVHAANIEAIAEAGITTGCGGDAFCPGDPVRRGQLASFLYRLVTS